MLKSTKLANMLFGRHNPAAIDGELTKVKGITFPMANKQGLKFEWEGADGLVFTLINRIIALEDKVNSLEFNRKK